MKRNSRFSLRGRVIIVTGGAGLLGTQYVQAIAESGGTPVLWDLNLKKAQSVAAAIKKDIGVHALASRVDITKAASIRRGLKQAVAALGAVNGLINNAANNPHVLGSSAGLDRFETFDRQVWERDLEVGLTGAFLCCQIVGAHMAGRDGGVIVNVASDLSLIAPDQRLYRKPGLPGDRQPTKPVSYSVVKHGIVGLTRYLATYWNPKVRVNAISPGGIYTGQSDEFVTKLTALIPLGRMANRDEYDAAIVFLLSDASAYMTGTNLVIDGGRTCW